MPSIRFDSLHGCKIRCKIRIGNSERHVQGTATYERDGDLGQVLRLSMEDQEIHYSILLQESQWQGHVLPPTAPEEPYHIDLTANVPHTVSAKPPGSERLCFG